MTIDFPFPATTNQTYTFGSYTWKYNGTAWDLLGNGVIGYTGSVGYTGSIGYTGSQGVGYTGSASTVIGYTGSVGYTGSIGYTGSQGVGYTGSIGYTGSQGVGGATWQAQNSNFNAVAGYGYFVDTSAGAVTATLPASPSLGQQIIFVDVAGTFDTNNLTIARNGNPIQRDNSDLTVSIEGAGFTLVYYDASKGWVLINK